MSANKVQSISYVCFVRSSRRARFGEMHFGETETISFQEFLYAVEGWCGLDDEDEEQGS